MTYCRFRSYSCGGAVIIPPPPLLLNSLILSYISRARGQEILQCINRSTLFKGDYGMAYPNLFFFPVDSPSYLSCVCPLVPDRGLGYSSSVHTPCDLLLCLHVTRPLCSTVPMERVGAQRDNVSTGVFALEVKVTWCDKRPLLVQRLSGKSSLKNAVMKLRSD